MDWNKAHTKDPMVKMEQEGTRGSRCIQGEFALIAWKMEERDSKSWIGSDLEKLQTGFPLVIQHC
jgi:hypothetical protein